MDASFTDPFFSVLKHAEGEQNMDKPVLVILAAGMGSRYGGLKQLDELGPNGETIMDYSIYDAIQAGFGKIVFVIRKDFEDQFRKQVLSKYEGHIPAELVFQSIDALPEGFNLYRVLLSKQCSACKGNKKIWKKHL